MGAPCHATSRSAPNAGTVTRTRDDRVGQGRSQLGPNNDCDPWAVYLAKASAGRGGEKIEMTKTQIEIMDIVKESGGIDITDLQHRLEVKVTDLEKEIKTLRHMELLKSEPVGGKTILKLLH